MLNFITWAKARCNRCRKLVEDICRATVEYLGVVYAYSFASVTRQLIRSAFPTFPRTLNCLRFATEIAHASLDPHGGGGVRSLSLLPQMLAFKSPLKYPNERWNVCFTTLPRSTELFPTICATERSNPGRRLRRYEAVWQAYQRKQAKILRQDRETKLLSHWNVREGPSHHHMSLPILGPSASCTGS